MSRVPRLRDLVLKSLAATFVSDAATDAEDVSGREILFDLLNQSPVDSAPLFLKAICNIRIRTHGASAALSVPLLTAFSRAFRDFGHQLQISGEHFVNGTTMHAICDALPHLRSLDLSRCRTFQAGSFSDFGRLQSLEVLDLTRAGVEDDALVHFQRCANLQVLRLAYCRVSDKGCIPLSHLVRLRLLDLSATDVTLEALRWLTVRLRESHGIDGLYSLERLLLRSCAHIVSDDHKFALERALLFPQLREFDLSGTSILPGHMLELSRSLKAQASVQRCVVVGVRLDIEREPAAPKPLPPTTTDSRWSMFDHQISSALIYYNPTSVANSVRATNVVVANEHEVDAFGSRTFRKEVVRSSRPATNEFDFDDSEDEEEEEEEEEEEVQNGNDDDDDDSVAHGQNESDVNVTDSTTNDQGKYYESNDECYDDDDVVHVGAPIPLAVFNAIESGAPRVVADAVVPRRERALPPPPTFIDVTQFGVPHEVGESIRDVRLPKRLLARKPLSQQLSRGLAIDATMLRTVMNRLHDAETVKGVPIGSIVNALDELFPELLDPHAHKMASNALLCTALSQCASSACECAAPVCCDCNAPAVQLVGSIHGNVQCACVESERRVWSKVKMALEANSAMVERTGLNWRFTRAQVVPVAPPLPDGRFVQAERAVADLFGPVGARNDFGARGKRHNLLSIPRYLVLSAPVASELGESVSSDILLTAFGRHREMKFDAIFAQVSRLPALRRCGAERDVMREAVVLALTKHGFVQTNRGKWSRPRTNSASKNARGSTKRQKEASAPRRAMIAMADVWSAKLPEEWKLKAQPASSQ